MLACIPKTIITECDGMGAYHAISKQYNRQDSVNTADLMKQLIQLKMKNSESVDKYINRFNKITDSLTEQRALPTEQLLIPLFCESLTGYYREKTDLLQLIKDKETKLHNKHICILVSNFNYLSVVGAHMEGNTR